METIIFDMDGTLFQTNRILGKALEKTFDRLREEGKWSEETPLALYEKIMGVPLPVVWETLCPHHDEATRNQSNEWFHEALFDLIRQRQGALYPSVLEVLETLHETYALFIASNGQRDYLNVIVKTYELDRWVSGVYSIEDVAQGTKTDVVRHILNTHEVASGWMVGDRLSDIQAGKGNGLGTIGVRFDFAQEEELQHADVVVDRFEEIKNVTVPGTVT